MSGVKPPCGKACPDRTAECKLTCDKWKVYEEAKRAEYAQREQEFRERVPFTAEHEHWIRKNMLDRMRRPRRRGC